MSSCNALLGATKCNPPRQGVNVCSRILGPSSDSHVLLQNAAAIMCNPLEEGVAVCNRILGPGGNLHVLLQVPSCMSSRNYHAAAWVMRWEPPPSASFERQRGAHEGRNPIGAHPISAILDPLAPPWDPQGPWLAPG